MNDFILFVLALVACHRIWHREDIFAWSRTVLQSMGGWAKPLWCASCSPIWLGAGLALAWSYLPAWTVWTLAAYPVIRLLASLYAAPWSQLRGVLPTTPAQPAAQPALTPQSTINTTPAHAPATSAAPSCASCKEQPADPSGDKAALAKIKDRVNQETASARSAANAELVVAIAVEAPESDRRSAVELVKAFQRLGLSSRLLNLTSVQGEAPAPALLSAGQELDPGDVLYLHRAQGLPLSDVVLLAGGEDVALSYQAALAGVLRMTSTPRPASEGDSSTLILANPSTEAAADEVAGRIVDLLTTSPIYRARKAAQRARGPSRSGML